MSISVVPDPLAPRADVTGSAPRLVWPKELVRPEVPPALVWFDLNHWIGLAKAAVGHPDGARYADLLDAACLADRRGAAIFVLNDTHHMELAAIADPRQRKDIAVVMGQLTGFRSLLCRPAVMDLEVRSVVDWMSGIAGPPHPPVRLLGVGIGHILGRYGTLPLEGDESALDATRTAADVIEQLRLAGRLEMEFHLLVGPPDAAMPVLIEHGYIPGTTSQSGRDRCDREQELQGILDAEKTAWRRGRIRDVVAARELTHESLDMLVQQLLPRGLSVDSLTGGTREGIRALTWSMPSTEVAVEMKTQYHRDRHHQWTVNDVRDIDALSLTVPYCDVVYTDSAARNAVKTATLDQRMGTVLPRTPTEATELLQALPSPESASTSPGSASTSAVATHRMPRPWPPPSRQPVAGRSTPIHFTTPGAAVAVPPVVVLVWALPEVRTCASRRHKW
jgi:hypothetical protein